MGTTTQPIRPNPCNQPTQSARHREAANGQRFAELYCPILPEIRVPRMHTDYTTAR